MEIISLYQWILQFGFGVDEEVISTVVEIPMKPQEGVDYYMDRGLAKAMGKELQFGPRSFVPSKAPDSPRC